MENQRDEIIHQLKALNAATAKQNSYVHIFVVGICYGIGFVVGSAILATIALGVLGPLFAQIPWVHDTFQRGTDLIRR